jgi:hypothetical protein
MLQDRYEIDKLFDSTLKLTNQMDPVLAEIDQLLEDEALCYENRLSSHRHVIS